MKTVLIVDDAAFMRRLLTVIMMEMGFEVSGEASTGSEAVHLYSLLKPDLVIMDIMMPVMDGITALRQIVKKHPDAKIIMCSTSGQQKTVVTAIQAGAKDFIVKPFQPDRFKIAIINAIT